MSTRRIFLGAGAAALTAARPVRADLNGKVRVAVIGLNGRGKDHIAGFMKQPDVEIPVVCDVDLEVANKTVAMMEQRYGKKPEIIQDLRKLYERKDVDAVSIATPNHWHSLAAIWACQAGKDVYVEKPGSHNIYEGRKLVQAAHKYNRIVQHGVQLRSSVALQEAVQKLREGVIGKVYMARGLVYRWRPSIGKKGPAAVPATLNYDIWQGPAQERAYSPRFVHYNWHWHWDYGNGDVGNQGTHETDMCLWGLGVGLPSQVTSMGGKFLWDDDKETPEISTSTYLYPEEKKMIQFEVRHWMTNDEGGVSVGNIFYGSEGFMTIEGYDKYSVFLGQKKELGPTRKEGGDHYANFIKAVKSRKTSDQNGPVETAHTASALAHLGNISYRLGRQLTFDPKTERFVGDKAADAMLTRQYRKPFQVPEKV